VFMLFLTTSILERIILLVYVATSTVAMTMISEDLEMKWQTMLYLLQNLGLIKNLLHAENRPMTTLVKRTQIEKHGHKEDVS